MVEPYETLLGHYREHWLLGPHLQGTCPNFAGIMDAGPLGSLSSSEFTMVHIALAIWNGDRTARIADLAVLDSEHYRRAVGALAWVGLFHG